MQPHSFAEMLKQTIFLLLGLCFSLQAAAQKSTSLAERLGYPAGTKLLIIHADDLGVAHSQNDASLKALSAGGVSSASIMVPCPWLPEIAAYARAHAGKHDLGLHLTVTSEWQLDKWGPVAPKDKVGSLLDSSGYFYNDCDVAAKHILPREAETELRAQIERAKQMGIEPTHLDSHMGCLYWTNLPLFQLYLKVGREYHLPLRLSKNLIQGLPADFQKAVNDQDIVIDQTITASPADFKNGMPKFYEKALRGLKPGVSEIIIHLAYDDREMQGLSFEHPDCAAAWRQADFDFFTSPKCKKILEEEKIKLITFREVGRLIRP
jgi:hypothetical protein